MPRLEEFFKRYARGRGIAKAEELRRELDKILSVRAPTRITKSGRVVAATPATPYAPPREVTGALRRSVKIVRTEHGARLVVWKPYGFFLEKVTKWYGWPHLFMAWALERVGVRGRN